MIDEVVEQMKNRIEALDFIRDMVDTYGVRSCLDNEDDESLWFECPCCSDPILIGEDYSLEEVMLGCPICECDNYEE